MTLQQSERLTNAALIIWYAAGIALGIVLLLMLYVDAQKCYRTPTMVKAYASWSPISGCELRRAE